MDWFIKKEERISKLLHTCFGCRKTIPKKSKVKVITSANTENIYSLYYCEKCKDYCKDNNCSDCFSMEEAHEGYIEECRKERG